MANGWTSERRARQAELVKSWRPWECSTGPKTEAGKTIVARNAWKGGTRPMLRALAQALKAQREASTFEHSTSEVRSRLCGTL